LEEFKGKVRLVIKFLPYRYRDFAFIAAEAALSAWKQGKFWQMHWKLHDGFPALDKDSLVKYAMEIGLDIKRFKRDLDTMAHKNIIERDLALAKSLNLYNTPTFFINGRKIVGRIPYRYFKKVINEELSRILH